MRRPGRRLRGWRAHWLRAAGSSRALVVPAVPVTVCMGEFGGVVLVLVLLHIRRERFGDRAEFARGLLERPRDGEPHRAHLRREARVDRAEIGLAQATAWREPLVGDHR